MIVRLSGLARAAAGLVAGVAWFGLAVQLEASTAKLGSAADAVWVMLRYFTVIANGLAAILLSGAALGWSGLSSPKRLGGVAIAMLLVGVVYALLLRGMIELSGGAKLADTLLHIVTPVLVPIYWLAFVPKGELGRRDPAFWTVLPLAYFVYALGRGAAEGVYAYPFMNLAQLDWTRTLTNALLMALGFVIAGFAMLWLDRRLSRSGPSPG